MALADENKAEYLPSADQNSPEKAGVLAYT